MHYLALDTETTGLGYWDSAFCVTMAYRSADGSLISKYLEASDKDAMEDLYCNMTYPDTELVFHNAKFDIQKLIPLVGGGPDWLHTHDTECMSHLLDEQRPKSLKGLAKTLLGLETDETEALRSARRKLGLTKADGYDALPRDVLEPYALKDAEFTLLLFENLWPQIEGDPELLRLYREEQELMGVLFDMEAAGIGVDMDYVRSEAKNLATIILECDLKIRDMVGVEDFNPGSWQQVTAAFKERGIEIGSTKKEVLAELDDPLAATLLTLRSTKKQYDYFKSIQAEVGSDGLLHPNFKQWGTRGRRFSSGGESDS